MVWTAEQKQMVRDISIAQELGIKMVGRKVKICCPMPHHNDKTASFLIDKDNAFYCFGCGTSGKGWIDFLEKMGYDFKQIMEEYHNEN